jgi:hypothetical protein
MREGLKLKGSYIIAARDAKTGALLWLQRLDNQLMAINQTIRTQMLLGTYTGTTDALEIKYFAFGTGTAAVTVNDTQLGAEQFRKIVTQTSNPSDGVVKTVVALGTGEANFNIKEIGVFAGPNASAAADTGTLISRILVNIDKNSNIALNVIRTDTCTI